MPFLDSLYWDNTIGVCLKHMLPEIPCPACIASNDKDMESRYTQSELSLVEYGIMPDELE